MTARPGAERAPGRAVIAFRCCRLTNARRGAACIRLTLLHCDSSASLATDS